MIVNFTFYVFFAYYVIWYGYLGHRDFSNYQDFLNRELQYTSVRYNTCSGISITPIYTNTFSRKCLHFLRHDLVHNYVISM